MTLLELLHLLRKHLRLVVLLPVACALVMGVYSYLFMRNTYTASTSMYVLALNQDTTASNSLSTDLSASQMISNDVSTLLTSDRALAASAPTTSPSRARPPRASSASRSPAPTPRPPPTWQTASSPTSPASPRRS